LFAVTCEGEGGGTGGIKQFVTTGRKNKVGGGADKDGEEWGCPPVPVEAAGCPAIPLPSGRGRGGKKEFPARALFTLTPSAGSGRFLLEGEGTHTRRVVTRKHGSAFMSYACQEIGIRTSGV
jgi:hypothetical protein